ncbi:basic secretory protein-like protein [Roseibacillus ishigakijimensis]|uniref:F5/8 type C domain-containing protein n=1 Tax=Roseibacillus ishigakijimensis TaxID=454146 RepID=A0A934VMU3_9BACT|nr:basic secretory protein-like protein [Roseibacillus ishigakijimensis]MBK1834320.1 hypothetical protein [Roseibacillus ishigakijimensis]
MKLLLSILALLTLAETLSAAPTVRLDRNRGDGSFQFQRVPAPAVNDLAQEKSFRIIAGEADRMSADLAVLTDGKVPTADDQPDANFFFTTGSDGGRLVLDLGAETTLASIATYSWHRGGRAPQVYTVYGATGGTEKFKLEPAREDDPTQSDWIEVAQVDTRSRRRAANGQHAALISNRDELPLGRFRYLLFDFQRPDPEDPHGNTFLSEIDIVSQGQKELERLEGPKKITKTFPSPDGNYQYHLDTTAAPRLTEWSENELLPVIIEWYPKLIELLPSEGYEAPSEVFFEYRTDMGGTPAYAAGNRIALNANWFPGQINKEAKGCVVHEMGHVVQNYWMARRNNPDPKPTPGWITEGVCDYLRWFLYEPESRGARLREGATVNHNDSYRTSANFLDWVIKERDENLLQKLNAAAREGRYEEKLWEEWTGKSLTELAADWKKDIASGKR